MAKMPTKRDLEQELASLIQDGDQVLSESTFYREMARRLNEKAQLLDQEPKKAPKKRSYYSR